MPAGGIVRRYWDASCLFKDRYESIIIIQREWLPEIQARIATSNHANTIILLPLRLQRQYVKKHV